MAWPDPVERKIMFKRIALSTLAIAAVSTSALAQDAGEQEYLNSCATCHGASGTGDGPLADLMTVDLPDLTQLSAQNDGEFPMLDVIMTIDGRSGIRGHGFPMPVWGDRFKVETSEAGNYAAEIETRGRVLSLALYLQSLQE